MERRMKKKIFRTLFSFFVAEKDLTDIVIRDIVTTVWECMPCDMEGRKGRYENYAKSSR